MIELTARDGHKLYAYRADPEGSPKGAIVVLQEATGINPHVQKLADAFAAKGYVAVAPDLSGGPQSDAGSDAGLAENPDIARQLERDRAFAEIQAAVDAVKGAGKICVGTCREDNQLVVEIVDNGPGIPPEVQAHMFEPFYTTKPVGSGTGLGLIISNRIVADRHGGEIEFESKPGETRFKVRLPVHRKP